nr:hypothetical protein [Tanacetum cinerariifolium]
MSSFNSRIQPDKLNLREGTAENQGVGASGASCDGSSKDTEAGKHDELLSGMINDKCMAVMDALGAICDLVQAENNNTNVIPFLDDVLENEPWLTALSSLRNGLRPPRCDLCKIFGHVHDHCPKKVSIPITVVTPNVPTPTVAMTNDGFKTMGKKKKKGTSKSTNGGQTGGHSVKQNLRYEPKATTSAPKKGATNLGNAFKSSSMKNQPPKATITSTKKGKITMSNSYPVLEDESDKDVKNMYDESANLMHSKICKSSSTFTTAAG